jgi:hypothetical protein
VVRTRTRPGDRLGPNTAVRAAQQPQLALDHATGRDEIEMPPALEPAIVDLQPTGLPAARADAPAPPELDRHDHTVSGEADIDDGRSGQAEQPLECSADAHVALLLGR